MYVNKKVIMIFLLSLWPVESQAKLFTGSQLLRLNSYATKYCALLEHLSIFCTNWLYFWRTVNEYIYCEFICAKSGISVNDFAYDYFEISVEKI